MVAEAKCRGRLGFTIIEFLVVVAVLSLLMALIAPAVLESRSSARRTSCVNSQRQILVAAAGHESTFGVYPTAPKPHDFFKMISGRLEVVSNPDGGTDWSEVGASLIQCPSDGLVSAVAGRSSYVLNGGSSVFAKWNGVTEIEPSHVRVSDITDGLSNTAFLSETLARTMVTDTDEIRVAGSRESAVAWAFPNNTPHANDLSAGRVSPDRFAEMCGSAELRPVNEFLFSNRHWEVEAGYTHLLRPNSRPCLAGTVEFVKKSARDAFWLGTWTASSLHDAGVNVARCDGSVSFVSNNVDESVWRALGSRAGGD